MPAKKKKTVDELADSLANGVEDGANDEAVKSYKGQQINKDNAKELGRAGGIASGKSRRAKKELRGVLENILSLEIPPEKYEQLQKHFGLQGEQLTALELMWLGQLERAILGDARCGRNIADYSGTKPTEKTEVTANVQCDNDPLDAILSALGMTSSQPVSTAPKKRGRKKKTDSTPKEDK